MPYLNGQPSSQRRFLCNLAAAITAERIQGSFLSHSGYLLFWIVSGDRVTHAAPHRGSAAAGARHERARKVRTHDADRPHNVGTAAMAMDSGWLVMGAQPLPTSSDKYPGCHFGYGEREWCRGTGKSPSGPPPRRHRSLLRRCLHPRSQLRSSCRKTLTTPATKPLWRACSQATIARGMYRSLPRGSRSRSSGHVSTLYFRCSLTAKATGHKIAKRRAWA